MPTTYTSLIGLALPTTGELTGTWGTVVNDYITRYLDAAVAGTQTLSTDADVTLTVTNGSNLGATSAQYAILNCTGARTVQRTITVPAASKTYLVINGTTGGQSVKVVGVGPTTGVTLVNGERALIAWNGSDFVKVGGAGGSGTFNDVTITGGGNALNFTGTAQRITGDFSNATLANRLAFQSSTTNGNTVVQAVPNGTSVTSAFRSYNNSDPTNAAFAQASVSSGEVQFTSGITGAGTYLPMTFYTGGSERVRVDTSGRVGVGGTPTVKLQVFDAPGNSVVFSNTTGGERLHFYTRNAAGTSRIESQNSDLQLFAFDGNPLVLGTSNTERMRIDASGNVGIGTAPSYTFDVYRSGTNTSVIVARNDNSVAQFYSTSSSSFAGTSTNTPFGFITNNTERMRFLAGGGITSEDRADAVGYKGTPLNEQSANYTLVIGDMGKSITHPASDNNPRTFTIPANGSVAYPIGTTITFINMINTVTIAITTDTMYLAGAGTTGSRTLAAYGMATAVKMTSTTWIISGNGLT